ncbi:MAG: hypothetical protein LBQ46_06350 [Treponema sp.]|jgi:hypothetical protein|nr:hypothetical protein [Treponema sp.]
MKHIYKVFGIIVLASIIGMSLTSCYTLFNKNEAKKAVTFQSQEPGVEFELYKGNTVVAQGKTPYVVELGARFFNGGYTLKFKGSDGTERTQTVKGKVTVSAPDVVFLALDSVSVFCIVIDLITASGKLWTMPAVINLQTGGAVSYNTGGEGQVTLVSIADIPADMRQYLVPLPEGSYQMITE